MFQGLLKGVIGGQGQPGQPAQTGLLGNLSARENAPKWMTGLNDWLNNDGGRAAIMQLAQAYPGMKQATMDRQHDLAMLGVGQSPYMGIINEPAMRSLGVQSAGQMPSPQPVGGPMAVVGPSFMQAYKGGAFNGLWDKLFGQTKQG